MKNIFKLKNFFVDSDFYETVADFTNYLDLPDSEFAKNELEDEISYQAFTSTKEPILNYTKDRLFKHIGQEIIGALYDRNEDRYPEEPEDVEKKILKAFKESFDIEKFNSLLPKMFYPNGKKVNITKANIVEYLED